MDTVAYIPHSIIRQRVLELSDTLGRSIDYIEIGVFQGQSAREILSTGLCRRAVLIDNWSYGESSEEKTRELLSIYGDKVEIVSGESLNVLPEITGEFDLAYVDGDHTQNGTIDDMGNILKRLRPHGIMFVDDLNNEPHPYVHEVVKQFAKDHGLQMKFHDSVCGLGELYR